LSNPADPVDSRNNPDSFMKIECIGETERHFFPLAGGGHSADGSARIQLEADNP
jgi:hypothetical protein